MKQLVKHKWTLAGIAAGAFSGYLYYSYVGCLTGACPLQSNPWFLMAYGGLIGYFIVEMFRK